MIRKLLLEECTTHLIKTLQIAKDIFCLSITNPCQRSALHHLPP